MLYVTDQNIYFYSPFNEKTVVGTGTKIKISYESITHIKKESSLLVFPNAIRVILKSGEEILFVGFVSRDTCFSLLLKQLTNAGHASSAQSSLQAFYKEERMMDVMSQQAGKFRRGSKTGSQSANLQISE